MSQTKPPKTKDDWAKSRQMAARGPIPGKSRKKIGFCDLPGEVRNQIYACYFENGLRVELQSVPGRTSTQHTTPRRPHQVFTFVSPSSDRKKAVPSQKKAYIQPTVHITRPLFKSTYRIKPHYNETKWPSSIGALFLVSRQLYAETIILYYNHTTFHFGTSKRLRSFLTHVSPTHLAAIKTIELKHASYGEPEHPKNVKYKQIHDASFTTLCAATVRLMPGLRSLTVLWHLVECPLRFEVDEPWLEPLWTFASLNGVSDPLSAPRRLVPGEATRSATLKKLLKSVRDAPFRMHVRLTTIADSLHQKQLREGTIDERLPAAYEKLRNAFELVVGCANVGWGVEDAMLLYKELYRRPENLMWVRNLTINDPDSIFEV